MKAKSQLLIVGTTMLCTSIQLQAGQTPCCGEELGTAASAGQKQVKLENVSFYKVSLVCPGAPHIGCGSASKPLLLELEHSEVVSEAWLNRAGTVMAVVWSGQSKPRERAKALKTILKERDITATELAGAERQKTTKDFQSRNGWYRGVDVDRLSEEEAGVIAARWIGRFREKINLTEEKGKILQEALTAQLKRQLTGKTTREETREEMLKVARQNLDEKDVQVLLENFGGGFVPKKDE
jgi:hypothetical protein